MCEVQRLKICSGIGGTSHSLPEVQEGFHDYVLMNSMSPYPNVSLGEEKYLVGVWLMRPPVEN